MARTRNEPATARPRGVVLKYVLPAVTMWNAPALQGAEALAGDRLSAVDDAGELSPVGLGPLGDGAEIALVVLTDVGRVGARDGALLAQPGDGDRRVEPA
jgi:hypothetical protein